MGKYTADIKAFCEENGLDYNIFAGLINIKCPHRVKGKIRIDEENGKWDCLACNIQSKDLNFDDILTHLKGETKSGLAIYRMSEVEPEEIDWLWKPYIPMNKMTIIDGDPGVGKTFVTLDICARVSSGKCFPEQYAYTTLNGERVITHAPDVEPRNVMYCTLEDGVADTIRNRLGKMDYANLQNIYVMQGDLTDEGYTVPFNFTNQIDSFIQAVKQIKPALVVIDPLQSFIGVDMNKANETRPALQRMVKLAEEYGFALIIIRHVTKGSKEKGLYRGMGSIDIVGTARSAIYIGIDKEDPNVKIWAHNKFNLAVKGESLQYAICEGRINWLGKSSVSADDLNDPNSGGNEDNKNALQEAIEFINEMFKDTDKIETKVMNTEAKKAKISDTTLKRAKSKMGCFKSLRENDQWYWFKEV